MMLIRAIGLALVSLAAGGSAGLEAPEAEGAPGTPTPASHNVRLSLATLTSGEHQLEIEIRFFWDDLQLAVMENTSNMSFELAETPEVDSIVEGYINEMLTLQVEGAPLQGHVVARGIQDAARVDEVMWWYRLQYTTPTAPSRVYVKNRLLFNMFEDQRNIVHVTTASGKERAYYFSWDEEDVTVPLT